MLDKIDSPQDLKSVNLNDLPLLCKEIRDFLIKTMTEIGGHLGGALGALELSVALHFVFNAPEDKIIWDIGHQAHVHKILTKRKNKLNTIKKEDGLSGFCSIFESEYDMFGAGHSSTSISAALGYLLNNKNNFIIPIIGDGSMGAGIAFEALNNVPKTGKMIIILNDNDMSICESVGNISNHFKKLSSNNFITKISDIKTENNNNIFSCFDIDYIGVVDGQNILFLIEVLNFLKSNITKPVVLHIKTKKGYGLTEKVKNCGHSISVNSDNKKSYTDFVSVALNNIFVNNDKVCAISPAMIIGSGLLDLKNDFPNRVFDVGIAEQHAITFSGGICLSGMIPFCAIYSTFLQRGYDQVIHDIAIQKLPVRFLIDRAGFVGGDGATHHGSFDVAMLVNLPDFVVMSPSSGSELIRMINTSLLINDKPSAIRYPKKSLDEDIVLTNETIEIGKGKTIVSGEKIAILSYGDCLNDVLEANKILNNLDIYPTVFDLRFAKPIDKNAIINIANNHIKIITIEDGSFGGIGSIVSNILDEIEYKGAFKSLYHNSDFFTENASVSYQKSLNKIDIDAIIEVCK